MGRQVGEEALDACTWLGRWDAPAGTYHALARHLPTSGLTLVLRQLAPGSGAELTTLGAAVQGVHVNQAAPWRIYGLDLELPSGWRLEGLQQLAGLVRGVWFHYGPRALRPDQALVMRRMACAGRLLGDGSMRDWVRGGLGYGERATGEHEQDGVVRVSTTAPATNWWRRWCGRHDQREIHAWRIAAGDRLMVQEWKGLGAPLPCLRGAQTAPGSSG